MQRLEASNIAAGQLPCNMMFSKASTMIFTICSDCRAKRDEERTAMTIDHGAPKRLLCVEARVRAGAAQVARRGARWTKEGTCCTKERV